jgi:hypothetical protein
VPHTEELEERAVVIALLVTDIGVRGGQNPVPQPRKVVRQIARVLKQADEGLIHIGRRTRPAKPE